MLSDLWSKYDHFLHLLFIRVDGHLKGLASIVIGYFIEKCYLVLLLLLLLAVLWFGTIYLNRNIRIIMYVEGIPNYINWVVLWLSLQSTVVPDELLVPC